MSARIDVTPYLGLPWRDRGRGGGFDCWGGVRLVLSRERGLELPDYGDRYDSATDRKAVAPAINAGLVEGWERVPEPVPGGLVIFNIGGKPWHVGLIVDRDRFFHVPANGTSCVERLSSLNWNRRIEGFYVHV